MAETADARPRRKAWLKPWWNGLSTRARERFLLGSLVAAALAARDIVLLASSAGALAALELADLLTGPETARPTA